MPSQLHLLSLTVGQAVINPPLLSQRAACHEPSDQLLAKLEVRYAAVSVFSVLSKNWESDGIFRRWVWQAHGCQCNLLCLLDAGSKGEDFALSKEVSAAIDLLREAAASCAPPKKDGQRSLPKQVNQVLPAFACAVMREAERDKAVQKHVVDIVMSFLEPFTSRANLQTRIKTEWERVRGGLAAADSLLKSEIAKKAKGGGILLIPFHSILASPCI